MRPSRGWGFDFCLGAVGKIEPEVSGFNFFFRAQKLLTAMNTCFDEME